MTDMVMSKYAQRMMNEGFRNAYYIGRYQIYDKDETNRPPHRIYYIGHGDAFGVIMPEGRKKVGYQIWGISWVRGRSTKLDKAIAAALKGKFPNLRHNIQIDKRAIKHGKQFIKPTWIHGETPKAFAKKANDKLPIRGRKRTRRKLNI